MLKNFINKKKFNDVDIVVVAAVTVWPLPFIVDGLKYFIGILDISKFESRLIVVVNDDDDDDSSH